MRNLMLAVCAAALVAGCSPAKPKLSEEKLAEEIVEAGGVISLDKNTLEQVITMNLQGVAQQYPQLTPEQQVKLSGSIRTQMDTLIPELKKQVAGFLVESFDQPDLESLHAFVTSSQQQKIKDTMPSVMQTSLAAADAMVMKAVDGALKAEGIESDTAPGQGHGAPPGAAPAPATPAPAAPATPTKPQ
jgi:hypothetical protein